jgi:peptidoglycan-N-acetylmuramic acid deacetylase
MIGSLYTRGELAKMDRTSIPFGSGVAKSGVRSTNAVNMQQRFSKYDAHYIAEDIPNMYLTFDCGYEYTATDENGNKYRVTERILDVLKEKDVKAVFFITIHYAETQGDLIRRMIDEGHIVGNHTCYHPVMSKQSINRMVSEVTKLHKYVKEHYNYEMTLFRFPEGEFSEQSLAVLQSLGYTSVFWSFAYLDWDTEKQPAYDKALNAVMNGNHNGAIFLLHAISSANAAILPEAIDRFREMGYNLALFQGEPPQEPDNGDELVGSLYTRDQLNALNNENQTYGPGSAAGGKRPGYAARLEEQFGQKYDAHFIAPDDGKVYLTFSCGYEYENLTASVLDTLREKNVQAVFFINMHYAQANYDLVRRMIDEGHIIANHTRYHYTLAELSIDAVVQEILSLHEYVRETYGYEMNMFRPPSGYYSERVLAIAQSLGYTTVNWSFAYYDWEPEDQPDIEESKVKLIDWAHSGAIYALHTVSETNAQILADVIDGIRDKGLEFALYSQS